VHTPSSLLLLYEGIRNLFAAVDWGNDDQEGAACDYEAEFAVADVAFVVCSQVSLSLEVWQEAYIPVKASLTSSRTRFMSWS
jgi:hypothetical protein